ncbi:MAG: hypothetical protein QF577_00985 [Phycisphaerae bacterium]|nr:hypothetical protein [Phycisphaerae bacterium]MDP7636100.1 hypothetical protein [Phycisphaerae bacterium]
MMDRRSRICLVIILIGLANFVAYTIGYFAIGSGEAVNGAVKLVDGRVLYYLSGQTTEPVSREVFIYSGVHSISIWVTFGAVILAMLTLAKDRIVLSMRSAVVRGRAVITITAVVIAIVAVLFTYEYSHRFIEHLRCQSSLAAPVTGGK